MTRKIRWIVISQLGGIAYLLFGGSLAEQEELIKIDWANIFSSGNFITIILVQGFCLLLGFLYPITIDALLGIFKK